MPVELPLDKMTTTEKLQAMEALWADLSRDPAQVPSPSWHGDILREREQRAKEGKEQFLDWDTAKKQLRDRLS